MSQKTNTAHTGREIIKKIVFLFGGGKRQEGKGKSVISTGSLGRIFSDIVPDVLFKKKNKNQAKPKKPKPKTWRGVRDNCDSFYSIFWLPQMYFCTNKSQVTLGFLLRP